MYGILGPIELSVDGRRVAVPRGHAGSILGLLLLQPNEVVSADALIEALWRGDPPRTAPNVLHTHVATLRRALRGAGGEDGASLVERVETHPSGYLLRVEPRELDADAFEADVAEAGRQAPGDPETAADLLRTALGRWRGDVISGGTVPARAQGAIARLDQLRLVAWESLAELELRVGRSRDAVADLEPLVRDHPLRERLHALLMIALYRSGRQADALAAYRRARQVLIDELGVEPGPELRALELAVLAQDPGLLGEAEVANIQTDPGSGSAPVRATTSGIRNAPKAGTSFVGRHDELAAVNELLHDERLVTITGVGGSGKTRFAIEVATQAIEWFPGGAWFVDLTVAQDREQTLLAVATAQGIAEDAGRGLLESVIEGIGDAPRLLVLDNCEHVIEPCARLVEALLTNTPSVSIIATSRESLRLASEVLWRLEPLRTTTIPTSLDSPGRPTQQPVPDAVRLLLDRAARIHPGRTWTERELEVMAEICRRLDGLPLAIEMAAARLRVLEPADVLDRLDDRFRLLTDGGRTAIPRHRTLRATLDWSYELLDEADQVVLRRMSAFATAVSPAAVDAVCGGPGIDAVEAVVRLADRSLAQSTVGPDGRSRFGLLDTVREYGRVQLRATGELEAITLRHITYWTAFTTEALAKRDDDRDTQADVLEREIGELRLAIDRAHSLTGGQELALAGRLGWFWVHHTHLTEGRRLLERALSRPGGDELDRARCLCASGVMTAMQGDAAGASERFDAGLSILRDRGEITDEFAALDDLGWGMFWLGDVDAAQTIFERAVELADRAAVPALIRRANVGLCQMLVANGDVDRAGRLARQLLRLARGDLWTAHLAHHFLADVALMAGDPAGALEPYRTALDLAHRMDNDIEIALELQGIAMAVAGSGDPEAAIRLNGAAEAALETIGFQGEVAFWTALLDRYIGPAREKLGPGAAPIDRGGRSLSLEDAVREGLAQPVPAGPG